MNEHTTFVAAVYSRREQAEAAVDELWHAGFHKNQIGFLSPGHGWRQATTATERTEETAATGAVAGSITGGVIGALAGAMAMAIVPGLGVVVAGGILMGALGGAAAGAALGGFAGPFLAMGFSKEQSHQFETDFRAGRTILIVQSPDRTDEAWGILHSHGPTRLEIRGEAVAV